MDIEIKKLVRKDYEGQWWFTLRWIEDYKDGYGNHCTRDCCVDSSLYTKYRLCNKAAKEHTKRIKKLWEKKKT